MAHLTKPGIYNIEDSNIALLGSDLLVPLHYQVHADWHQIGISDIPGYPQLERHVREASGKQEFAWNDAGTEAGIQIWRIEDFRVVPWPKDRYGTFYDGDSYIILHTYKRSLDAKSFSYNLHFWLGRNTTQDEAGTAAYKTVELDDFLGGKPVQSREVQGYESGQFISYFPRFICLQGGVATGFHRIADLPPQTHRKLYRVSLLRGKDGPASLIIREVPDAADSLIEGDVYILDKGSEILQLNTNSSVGQERFKAAELVQRLINERGGPSRVDVFDEDGSGVHRFFTEFGDNVSLAVAPISERELTVSHPLLFRLSDASGQLTFEPITPVTASSLMSGDTFLVDASMSLHSPAIFVWIGKHSSLNERRMSLQYAQQYLYHKRRVSDTVNDRSTNVFLPIIKMEEGEETSDFKKII